MHCLYGTSGQQQSQPQPPSQQLIAPPFIDELLYNRRTSMKSIATLPAICCGPATEALAVHERDQLAAQFKALADPTRVAIVNHLSSADEVCVCNLVDVFDLS